MIAVHLLGACSESGLHPFVADVAAVAAAIEVTPPALDFWSVGADEAAILPFTIWSAGDALLRVEDIVIEGAASYSLVSTEVAFDLEAGGSREVEVAFTPLGPDTQAARALVTSNDPDEPVVTVELTGEGRVPSLVITPDPHDFGALGIGCEATVALTLQNVGAETLTIDGWSYDGGGAMFVDAGNAPPLSLAPWAWETVTVAFSPVAAGIAAGTLTVASNDPRGARTATQTGSGAAGTRGADRFVTEADPPVDVLLAVDQSASMDDDAASMGAAFSAFIDTIGAVTSDWHLGVTTTDDGCFHGGVLTASTGGLAASFITAVTTGDDRDIVHDEALLQLADAALTETSAGGCNEGFLRPGALLHVIVVSDEPERSREEAAAFTWDHWVDRYAAYVASPALLMVSGVVDSEGCAEGDAGYAEAIAATGGQRLSICSGDWSARLASLAAASVAYAWTFELSAAPVERTIAVSVDGAALTSGWRWDATLNAVVVESLAAGATVDVTYDIAGGCPR